MVYRESMPDPNLPEEPYFIWWLSPLDLDVLDIEEGLNLPAYLESELRSAQGRKGQGRLWDAHKTGLAVEPWPDTTLGRYCSECAGIIIGLQDVVAHLRPLPGLLTDFKLERVNP